jgi:GTP pyrophosphokinase
MKKLQYKTVNAFYAAVGDETLGVAEVKEMILEATGAKPVEDQSHDHTAFAKESTDVTKFKSSDDILVIDAKNVKNLDYRMAKCCNPVFGDDVFGFVTIKEGVKIHRISCPNAARLIEMYPYRIQKVKWSTSPSTSSFQTTVRVTAEMEPSVINEVIDLVNSFKASIRNFNVSENSRQGVYDITMKIAVPGNLELDKVLSQLRNLRNVIKVTRG